MRLLDVLFRRTHPPESERAVKGARLEELEQEAAHEVGSAKRALEERSKVAGYGNVRLPRRW